MISAASWGRWKRTLRLEGVRCQDRALDGDLGIRRQAVVIVFLRTFSQNINRHQVGWTQSSEDTCHPSGSPASLKIVPISQKQRGENSGPLRTQVLPAASA